MQVALRLEGRFEYQGREVGEEGMRLAHGRNA